LTQQSNMPPLSQPPLFDDTDALPLFSGTAIVVDQAGHTDEQASAYQQGTFSACPICHDTGKVGTRYCWCQAGLDARRSL